MRAYTTTKPHRPVFWFAEANKKTGRWGNYILIACTKIVAHLRGLPTCYPGTGSAGMLAQELCGGQVRWISCAQGWRNCLYFALRDYPGHKSANPPPTTKDVRQRSRRRDQIGHKSPIAPPTTKDLRQQIHLPYQNKRRP